MTTPVSRYDDTATFSLLTASLPLAVQMDIAHFRRNPADLAVAQQGASRMAQDICEHGDALLFRSRHSAMMFSILSRALAVLAFAPGGVDAFGLHFESTRQQEQVTA